jgi:hypothetical protein
VGVPAPVLGNPGLMCAAHTRENERPQSYRDGRLLCPLLPRDDVVAATLVESAMDRKNRSAQRFDSR